jgi:wyosine [tRNA(Phe)-imidazoG37] synthetase (radical SAM superfamily)
MNYVYGPIPSRRLGKSLGIDPIPLKTCNWNCIYCQLGRSTPLTNERREYVPRQAVLDELAAVLAHHVPGEIDFVSFVGSGEPTLNSELGWMIREVKALTCIPVAVITNGVLLHMPGVRHDLVAADVVMPTLSAGSADLYKRIHRPHPEATYERLLNGLLAFRAEFAGRLWLEVMLLAGVNDTPAALADLAAAIHRVAPDEVHVVIPDRPPAEPWVAPPDDEGLMRAIALLGPVARLVHPYTNGIDISDYATPEDAILSIVTRHPMSEVQLEHLLLRWPAALVGAALAGLHAAGSISPVERLGARFWIAAPSVFPVAVPTTDSCLR